MSHLFKNIVYDTCVPFKILLPKFYNSGSILLVILLYVVLPFWMKIQMKGKAKLSTYSNLLFPCGLIELFFFNSVVIIVFFCVGKSRQRRFHCHFPVLCTSYFFGEIFITYNLVFSMLCTMACRKILSTLYPLVHIWNGSERYTSFPVIIEITPVIPLKISYSC